MADFIPQSDDNLVPFYDTQLTKLPLKGPILGIAAPQIAATVAACGDAQTAILTVAAKKAELAGMVADKETKVALANGLVREAASDGKDSAAYTPSIGQEMEWIAGGTPFDPGTYKAIIRSVEVTAPVEVTLEFRKASGNIDAVYVYMRLQGAAAWTRLNLRMNSPYIDHTPLAVPGVPEVREYRIRAVIDDVEIGLFSDVVLVTVS